MGKMETQHLSGKTSKSRQKEIARIVDERSIDLNPFQRLKLRRHATAALKTNAGRNKAFLGKMFSNSRWVRPRQSVINDSAADYNDAPQRFGNYMAGGLDDVPGVTELVKHVFDPDNEYPFAVVRNVYPKRLIPLQTTRNTDDKVEWYLRHHVHDFISSGLTHSSGTTIHDKKQRDDEKPKGEYSTDPAAQKSLLTNGRDLPLNYRQATPDFKFTGEAGGGERAARIIVFACVENPISDPIYLLPTSAVFGRLPQGDFEALCQPVFTLFDKYEENLTQKGEIPSQCIAYDNGSATAHWLSFDINRLILGSDAIAKYRQSLRALIDTIESVANDPDSGAIPITLRRGDALIIDNYRMLYRRKEQDYSVFHPMLLGRPPVRWLFSYYGFPL